jgi:tetratricopeptide (TPR) repeat protein
MRLYVASVVCALVLTGAAASGQSTTAQLADAGWQAIEANDADKAASLFRDALSRQPRDAELLYGCGVAAHLQGRDADALRLLQKSLEIEPRLTGASELLGEIAYREGELDLAIKTFEKAIALAPRTTAPLRSRLDAWRSEASVHSSFSTVKDDRFSVMFDGPVEQKLAIRATTVLGNAFWNIGKAIGAYPNHPINVILYSDQQFRDITGAPEWAGGGFDGQIRLPVRGALGTPQLLDRLLVHELVHAMLNQVASRNVPVWFNEGLAMHFEGDDATAMRQTLTRLRMFIPLVQLQSSFEGLTTAQATIAYAESLFATSVLLERIGPAGLGPLLQDLDRGARFEDAVQRFGFTFGEFEKDLVQRIAKRPASSRN